MPVDFSDEICEINARLNELYYYQSHPKDYSSKIYSKAIGLLEKAVILRGLVCVYLIKSQDNNRQILSDTTVLYKEDDATNTH